MQEIVLDIYAATPENVRQRTLYKGNRCSCETEKGITQPRASTAELIKRFTKMGSIQIPL